MHQRREVVITGVGVVSPIGIGSEAFWQSLMAGRSGVRPLRGVDTGGRPQSFGGEITDFDPKEHVRPRKSLKVMNRDIQLGVAAANLAITEARLEPGGVDPERFGVVYGCDMLHIDLDEIEPVYRRCVANGQFDFGRWGVEAKQVLYPLFMLKYLPNMPACQVAIAHQACGPNNSITAGEVSSLLAIGEAFRVVQRGSADVMIGGGTGTRLHPTLLARSALAQLSRRDDAPEAASRPFDAARDGLVNGEGSAAFVLESADHARRRRATPLARVVAFGSAFGRGGGAHRRRAIQAAIAQALSAADCSAADVGHVNAHGLSTTEDDAAEAQAVAQTLGERPVTAPKSYFGHLGAGTGAVEMAASVLALPRATIPHTLNYEEPDQACPVSVVREGPQTAPGRHRALLLNHAPTGQATALLLESID